jgi:hypothetical protein
MYINRYNIYTFIHKALRSVMCQALTKLGRVDDTDVTDIEQNLKDIEKLLSLCLSHLEHENQFIHSILLDKAPGLQLPTIKEHEEHVQHISDIQEEIHKIRLVSPPQRQRCLLSLYRHMAVFLAINFEHMQLEETLMAQRLWDNFSDDEIHHMEQNLVASIPPEQRLETTILILANISHSERRELLAGMRESSSQELFALVVNSLKTHISEPYWQKLNAELQMAA